MAPEVLTMTQRVVLVPTFTSSDDATALPDEDGIVFSNYFYADRVKPRRRPPWAGRQPWWERR